MVYNFSRYNNWIEIRCCSKSCSQRTFLQRKGKDARPIKREIRNFYVCSRGKSIHKVNYRERVLLSTVPRVPHSMRGRNFRFQKPSVSPLSATILSYHHLFLVPQTTPLSIRVSVSHPCVRACARRATELEWRPSQ